MAKPLLTLDIMGDIQLSRGLSRFADNVKDLSKPFREIVKQFHEIESQQFASEGGRGSGGWAPLAPITREQKAREGFPSRILVRTRLLLESLTGKNPWSIMDVKPLELRVGTKLEYGRYHQEGTRHMPKRPVIDLTERDKMSFMKTIQRYLVQKIRTEIK